MHGGTQTFFFSMWMTCWHCLYCFLLVLSKDFHFLIVELSKLGNTKKLSNEQSMYVCVALIHRHRIKNTLKFQVLFTGEIAAGWLRWIKLLERTKVQGNRHSNNPCDLWASWRIYHILAWVHMIILLWSLPSDSPRELICKPEVSGS